MSLKNYWDQSTPMYYRQECIDYCKEDDYNEAEDDEYNACAENGHHPDNRRKKHTECIWCHTALTKVRIDGEAIFVDSDELTRLEQWNAMSVQGGAS